MINVVSWFSPKLLDGTNYAHGENIEGDELNAFLIAEDLFKSGLNVMILRKASNILIAVSDGNFGQR